MGVEEGYAHLRRLLVMVWGYFVMEEHVRVEEGEQTEALWGYNCSLVC